MDLEQDFAFAAESLDSEFSGSVAQLMRYVAAINPEATRVQFVEAAKAAGYNSATALRSFSFSRRFDADSYGHTIAADGRLIEAQA